MSLSKKEDTHLLSLEILGGTTDTRNYDAAGNTLQIKGVSAN